ncbi:YbjN domain-containing protein [Sphingobium sp. AP49]|uniref:YbjN domain-containing protein n=1 Tax=Sphingobium sp. AP49 TaxID=1144307 RepID=UPI00026EDF47|nr:YbjN domain-containing protein [Sphingobium sp. AP49]WHO37140.1 YbjN domain-containing protein [Sphingobium sp. AP49]
MRALWLLPMLMLSASGAIAATPPADCAANLVCASRPQSVVEALQGAGYKAALTKNKSSGNPMIESAASGYNFTVYFYGCEKAANCNSLQFAINFADDGGNTPELANKWNQSKRFIQMSIADDKTLDVAYDVSTIGGLNQDNFADVVDWWAVMLGELGKFFKENPAPTLEK